MTLEQLIEQYRQKIERIDKEIKGLHSYHDFDQISDMQIVRSECVEFVHMLEKLKPDFEFEGMSDTYRDNTIRITKDGIQCITEYKTQQGSFKFEEGEHYQITIKKLP